MTLLQHLTRKMHLSQTKETIVQNLFWSVLGKIVSMLGGLIVGIIVARYLGPERYGLMNYVISLVFLFQTLAVLGLDSIEVREEAKGDVAYQKIIGTAFGMKIVAGVLCISLVILTAWLMDGDGYTTLLVAIYSMSIVFNSLGVIRNYFMSIVQNEYIVKAEIARTVIGIGIKLLLLALNVSLTWFVAAYMFDMILVGSGYCIAYHSKIGILRSWHFDKHYALFLLKESFPLMLTSAAVIVYQRIDQVMIGQMIDKEAVGFFSVASRFVEVLLFIPMMLAQTITPVLVRIRQQSQSEYEKKGQLFMNMSIWISLLVGLLTSLFSYWIVTLTFGQTYLPAVAVLQVMSFKTASVALSNTAGAMLVTEGLQKYAILRDSLGCVVCIVLNYFLLPRYGIIAAAFVSIACNVAAGYLADALIPAYHHLFRRQTRAIFLGWKDILSFRRIMTN